MCAICDRRSLLRGPVGAGLLTLTRRSAFAQSQAPSSPLAPAPTLPGRGECLVQGAVVISMDPAVGDVVDGAVHVKDGVIVAVGKDIKAPGAEKFSGEGLIVRSGQAYASDVQISGALYRVFDRVAAYAVIVNYSQPILRLLLSGLVPLAGGGVEFVLSMTGLHRLELAILSAGVVLVACLLLIPAFGATGAALSVAVVFVAVNAVRCATVIRILQRNPLRLADLLAPAGFCWPRCCAGKPVPCSARGNCGRWSSNAPPARPPLAPDTSSCLPAPGNAKPVPGSGRPGSACRDAARDHRVPLPRARLALGIGDGKALRRARLP